MSAGHPHRAFNKLAHIRELKNLLAAPSAVALMRRWNKLDAQHDIVYLCGYNVWGTTRFVDRDALHALYDRAYAEQIVGESIDTGLSPDDTLECLLRHEAIEKTLLDADNTIDTYDDAHEFATAGEHELVRAKGGRPVKYERGLARIIAFCQKKPLKLVPQDYACAPLLDDPDNQARRTLKILQGLKIPDALKKSKASLDYGLSTSADHCSSCKHWQPSHHEAQFGLAACQIADGLVRDSRWCKQFEPAEEAHDEAHST
jgi:hypothetical protein